MGYVKTATGEYCIAVHILEPLRAVTRDTTRTSHGTTVVLFHDTYRPVDSPVRRNPARWGTSVQTLIEQMRATRFGIMNGNDPEVLVAWRASNHPDRSLWATVRDFEERIDTSTRAYMAPCSTFTDFLERRTQIREELWNANGDIRETATYKRELDRQRALMLDFTVNDYFSSAYKQWEHILRYFPVSQRLRTGMELAFDDNNVHQIVALARQLH